MNKLRIFLSLLFFTATISLDGVPNFILLGPPGCGKGTFSDFMIKNHGYHQIGVGDLLREEIRLETEIGKIIKAVVARGDYVDDAIVFKIVEDKISLCIANQSPFIIDGFPKDRPSLEFIIKLLQQKKLIESMVFVHFIADDLTCIERISSRCICPKCSKIYNKQSLKPMNDMVCDDCKTELIIRLADTVEVTKKRLSYFREIIEPLIDEIKIQKFSVLEIDTTRSICDCLTHYKDLI